MWKQDKKKKGSCVDVEDVLKFIRDANIGDLRAIKGATSFYLDLKIAQMLEEKNETFGW